MGKYIIIVFFALLGTLTARSQNNELYKQVDEDTYALFLDSDWKALKDAAASAISQGVDFYYLRVRLGMAYYHLGRYDQAREQFSKALNFQKRDPLASEYLYFSNIYSGRYGEARRLLLDMTVAKRKELNAQAEYSLQALIMEGGWMGNSSAGQMISDMPREQTASSYLMREVMYANLGLTVNLGYASSALVSYNRYNTNFIQGLYIPDSLYTLNQTGSQNGLYLNYVYQFPESWYGGVAYHRINGDYQFSSYQELDNSAFGLVSGNEYYDQSYFGFFAGKHMNNFNIFGQVSKNRFWDGTWIQAGLRAFWYPTGSTRYYVGAGFDRMSAQDYVRDPEFAFKFTGGFTLLRNMQVEASHITGDLGNWADARGYYIFNTVHPILSRTTASLLIKGLSPYLTISLTAVIQNRSHAVDIYLEDGTAEPIPQQFMNTSFFGGITWIL